MATSPTFSLRARFVIPMDRAPIRNGWLTIADGRIAAVGGKPAGERRDLGEVAILPGLINAHTHLEFSQLEQPLGKPGMSFTKWIREVIRWRSETTGQDAGTDWRNETVRQGLLESLCGGATTLGEISTLPPTESRDRYEGMQGVNFLELLGLAPERHDELLAAAGKHLEATRTIGSSLQPGLSPHAPYTVSPQLVEDAATLAAATHTAIAMHLAETREELELLRSGSGLFHDLLVELGAWYSQAIPRDSAPLDYLKRLARAERSLIVHGNYLDLQEIEFAGQHHERMSVVYCPRTHAYFGHDDYPLRAMLDCGVNVALGTDSRASNPDLNMLNEVRYAAARHRDVSPETIFRLATSNAAQALGMGGTHGTLRSGKQADFIVVPIASSEASDPYERLVEAGEGVQQVFRGGTQLVANGGLA